MAKHLGAESNGHPTAGHYGRLGQPDRHLLARDVEKRIGEFGNAIGMGTATILDRHIDGEFDDWRGQVEEEYTRRLQLGTRELATLNGRLDTAKDRLRTADAEYLVAKDAFDRAHYKLMGKLPPTAVAEPAGSGSAASAVGADAPAAPAASNTGGPSTALVVTQVGTRPVADVEEPPDNPRDYPRQGQLPSVDITDVLHYALLGLAMLADMIAFYQVLALVLGTLPVLLYAVVLAVSVMALALMHQAGKTLRDVRARGGDGQGWLAVLFLLAWAGLGVGAYFLRLKTKDDLGSGANPLLNFGGLVTGTDTSAVQTKALIFLAIYVTTGVIALAGAYLTWNPNRKAYRRADRTRNQADAVRARAQAEVNELNAQREQLESAKESETALRDSALRQRADLACWLKAISREEIAKKLQDPRVTQFLLEQPIPGCPDRSEPTPGGEARHA